MGSSIVLGALCATLAVGAAASVLPASAPLKPSSPWNVEYADSMCILAREFGAGDAKVTLAFRPGVFSEQMRVVLVRKDLEKAEVRGDAQLSFNGRAATTVPYVEQFLPDRGVRIITIDLKQQDIAPLATAKEFRINAGKGDYTLATDMIGAAMKALDACQKDLLVTWGMDPKTIASIATFPKAWEAYSIFTASDYPLNAFLKRQQGTSGVRFWVRIDGRVRDCQVVESSGNVLLDERTCAIITKRGRYHPARTASGEAVESIGFHRFSWVLPY